MRGTFRILQDHMKSRSDRIADCVLSMFETLPSKAKPRRYPNGRREWVPLSGIVLSTDDGDVLDCVSLGTGMRCLPQSKVPLAKGRSLHDWHAEIVALRAFNLFLIQECAYLAKSKGSHWSKYIRRRTSGEISALDFQPFGIKDDVKIHMYSSEAPCGDASMELVIGQQEDPRSWTAPSALEGMNLNGRGYFSELGTVRRKPSRGDAPTTISKSCSDKICMKQCTSLLSSPAVMLIHPSNAYLHELVLHENQHVSSAIHRAFSPEGRMHSLKDGRGNLRSWPGGFAFKPFKVSTTARDFAFSRPAPSGMNEVIGGSNITACWTPGAQQVLIGGTIQGHKQFSVKGTSIVSKLRVWEAVTEVAELLESHHLLVAARKEDYAQFKTSPLLETRRIVKKDVIEMALRGWTPNAGGDCFALVGR